MIRLRMSVLFSRKVSGAKLNRPSSFCSTLAHMLSLSHSPKILLNNSPNRLTFPRSMPDALAHLQNAGRCCPHKPVRCCNLSSAPFCLLLSASADTDLAHTFLMVKCSHILRASCFMSKLSTTSLETPFTQSTLVHHASTASQCNAACASRSYALLLLFPSQYSRFGGTSSLPSYPCYRTCPAWLADSTRDGAQLLHFLLLHSVLHAARPPRCREIVLRLRRLCSDICSSFLRQCHT